MKKKQLSKLAVLGLATGVALASTVSLSANTLTETNGTYLAAGCGGGCGAKKNQSNPENYTADAANPATNAPVNPNMAPKPESMRDNAMQGQNNNMQKPQNANTQSGTGPMGGQSTSTQGGSMRNSCGGGSCASKK